MFSALERHFRLSENGTTVQRELLGGSVTFLAMAYIVFVNPAVLSGELLGKPTGLDFGAVMTATCLAAALSTGLMALLARYPIAQAPGMGENFFFAVTAIPMAAAAGFANPGHVALGVVFVAGIAFLALTFLGLRELLIDAIPPPLKTGIAVGIGLFIALIGLENASLIRIDHTLSMNTDFASPDLLIFFISLLATAGLYARGVRGALLWGIAGATLLTVGFKLALPELGSPESITHSMLATRFEIADAVFSSPPSLAPTFLAMDVGAAFSLAMLPLVVVFLVMDLFDTIGTLLAVGDQGGFIVDGKLPRARRALLSDAIGTTVGACLGTSTVTSYIESSTGIEQGARTGLAGLVTAAFFLLALFLHPVVAMVGSYPPITAPALVIVGALMVRTIKNMEWGDFSDTLPAFLVILGIPATYSIADGMALGIMSYPALKAARGRGREVHWLLWILAVLLVLYYTLVRGVS